jgi:UMF1 family MFS transporter
VFSIPIFAFVPEPKVPGAYSGRGAVRQGFQQLKSTFREVRKFRVAFTFLLAYWLYIDGIDTVVRMAVDYGMSLGFDSKSLIKALLITQFVGFPAAIAFGRIGEKLGAKTGILIGIAVQMGVATWGFFMQSVVEFYGIAIGIGLVLGGVQSLSRSLYARLIPRDKAGEFFGFYNMLGKFAAVIGPGLVGLVSFATGNPRYSILSVIVLFLAGASVLYFLDEEEGRRLAKEAGRNSG